jgi:hypothetical protein
MPVVTRRDHRTGQVHPLPNLVVAASATRPEPVYAMRLDARPCGPVRGLPSRPATWSWSSAKDVARFRFLVRDRAGQFAGGLTRCWPWAG